METELKRHEMNCPINGKACVDGIRSDFELKDKKCRWWTHLAGKDPQSEQVVDYGDCAVAWAPITMLESSQMVRQNTATMQEFRNESHDGLAKLASGLKLAAHALGELQQTQRDLIEGVQLPDELEHKNGDGNEN